MGRTGEVGRGPLLSNILIYFLVLITHSKHLCQTLTFFFPLFFLPFLPSCLFSFNKQLLIRCHQALFLQNGIGYSQIHTIHIQPHPHTPNTQDHKMITLLGFWLCLCLSLEYTFFPFSIYQSPAHLSRDSVKPTSSRKFSLISLTKIISSSFYIPMQHCWYQLYF